MMLCLFGIFVGGSAFKPTVQGTSETTSGVLLTSLVTLSKEGHSKHRKSSTKSDQNDSLDLCPNLRRTPEANGTDITGEPPTQG